MAVFSVLRPSLQGCRALMRACSRAQIFATAHKANTSVVVRQMSDHKKTMEVIPSRFEWDRFKDDAHFYFFLGLVPMGLLIFYANLYIGPAELADIPEDYEPKHWEYYKSPIIRFMSRYVYSPPEKAYEVTLHVIHEQNERRNFKILEKKVKDLMYERQDYKGWYYIPVDKNRIDKAREQREYDLSVRGSR